MPKADDGVKMSDGAAGSRDPSGDGMNAYNNDYAEYDARDKHRALVALLEDSLHELNIEAVNTKREVDDFFECLEAYFASMDCENADDGDPIHELTQLKVLKLVIGPKARAGEGNTCRGTRYLYKV